MSVMTSSLSSTPLPTLSDELGAFGGSDLSTLSSVEPEVKILHKAEAGPSKEREKERGIYCHQCRQKCDAESVLRCTRLKQHGKAAARACNLAFCDRDLLRRYETNAKEIRVKGYEWTCPCCRDICQTSLCRKKKGLEPLGYQPRPSDVSLPPLSRPVPPPRPGPSASTDVFGFFNDSDLSDVDEVTVAPATLPQTPVRAQSGVPGSSVKTTKQKGKKTADAAVGDSSAIDRPKSKKAKMKGGADDGGTAKDSSAFDKPKQKKGKVPGAAGPGEGNSSARQKPTKKKVVAPLRQLEGGTPAGNKPKKKAKAAVTSKSEASPRTPKIKKPEMVPEPPAFEKVDTKLGRRGAERRIQLREYLFRFRATLSIPERSLPAVDDFDRPLTDASVRLFGGAMLDMLKDELGEDDDEELRDVLFRYREEIRYYADLTRFAAIFTSLAPPLRLRLSSPDLGEDMGRRASRIPQPDEIVRMLLALAERTLTTPLIRADLDATSEVDERRQHARGLKAETTRWEGQKKKLSAAILQAATPADGKRVKGEMKEAQKEHDVQVAQLNVNLRAALSKKALRHEPLGTDPDGRVYYCLCIRPVDDDSRAPIGWASGLLVWGKGIIDEEDLPAPVERWSHFGDAASVRKLIMWLQYKFKKSLPHKQASTPKRKFEIVVPVSRKRKRSRSDSSDLSTPPEDLASLYAPPGYVLPRDMQEEQGRILCERLAEVCDWLDVLEWKGMGEVMK